MNKPSLLWFYPHLSFWNGGARYVFEVCQRLSKRYDLYLVVSKENKKITSDFKNKKIKVLKLDSRSTSDMVYWLFFPFFIFYEYLEIRKIIKKHHPQAIISSLFPSNLWALFFKIPHIQVCWEPYAFFYDKDLIGSLQPWKATSSRVLAFLYSWLDRLSLKMATKVLTLNKATGKWIRKIYKKNANDYTYMGVDFRHFRFVKNLTIHEKKLTDKPLLFHSTDFTALKGTEELLKAMKTIKKKMPDVLLLISSPHSIHKNKNKLITFINDNDLQTNVEFLGTVSYDLLPEYYSLVDIVVFTGIGDSGAGAAASLSVLEALACKTPVVRSFYTKEEVIDGKTGFLVNPHQPKKIAEACLKLLSNHRLRKKMSAEARKSIIHQYQWDKTTQIILKAINA